MEPYKHKKPRYVREWYIKLRQRLKKIMGKEGLKRTKDEILGELEQKKAEKTPKKRIKGDPALSLSSYDEPSGEDGNEQSDYDDKLAMEIDFSSEDEEELGGITVKNMGKLLHQKYKPKKEGTFMPTINYSRYYKEVERLGSPKHQRVEDLKDE